ncbi:MAG: carboxypeptidase regulatory-like domain-containing protein [Candidatus Acidiferrales bacterium]
MKRYGIEGRVSIWLMTCLAAILLCVSLAHAQSAGTGAIAGTVTDPSGAAVVNSKVTLTSLATGQARTATTGQNGDYRFSLLPPGDYKLDFSASGFKTASVASLAVTVTETATVNQALQVGAVTQTVTVESNAQVLQTESATLGSTVSGARINALPMANGNYTEILSLSPGTSASVDNADQLGKGTQDISANGVNAGSNNFQMDGVAINNIANSGSANDGTIYTGIPIPSTDAIQEFKVQTSTYDASYGRNPGANVVVNTKSGTNQFHGSAFEFLRNSVLNADDFFYDKTPAEPRQVLDQNQFGGTLGGPIKKDKLFFFFSYRGTRGKNGVAPQGETFNAILPTELDPYAAIGSRGTCITPAAVPDYSSIASSCDATAQAFANNVGIINVVGLRLFQLQTGTKAGVPNNYYIPAPSADPQFCTPITSGPNAGISDNCNFDVPALYSENQYVANGDYVINSKHTLTTKYFYTANPQTLYLGQAGGDLPGTPEYTPWGNQAAQARLTSLVTSNFVNVARVSYQRNNAGADVDVPPGGCPNAGKLSGLQGCGSPDQLGMQPLVPGFYEPPSIIDILDNFTLFGGLLPFHGPTNQVQLSDEVSWQHGKHSIRAGFEYEWTNWPLSDQGLQQGLLLTAGTLSAPAPFSPGLATGGNAGPWWDVGCLFCVKGITGQNGIIHFYHLNNQSAYVLDDWKVNSRLTFNLGLRWEYDGLLTDSLGRLTQVWLNRMVDNSALPTSEAAAINSPLGVQQYVVPSNYAKFFGAPPAGVGTATNENSIQGHAPYSNFAPRFGFAWQPFSSNLVVRGGFGIFYDRVGLDSVVHAYQQGYPYAATYDYSTGSSRWAAATLAQPYPQISLVCLPSDPNCNSDFGLGFAPRFADPSTANSPAPINSSLSTPFDPNSVHTPLVQEYSIGVQYQFQPGWVLDVGYVGSSGINLLDYNHNHNQATLATPTNAYSYLCTGTPPICNTAANAQFRVPYLGYAADGLAASDDNGRSNYNSLQISVQHQFSHGLSFQAAYTWDKDLTDVFFGPSANINDALCMRCQYGRASFDRPQRLVVNYSYDLPFGKNMTGVSGRLLGGWNVSGITIAQSGDPLTFISATNAGGAYGTSTTSYLTGVTTAQYCSGFGNGNIKSSGSIESMVKTNPANGTGYFNRAGFCAAPLVPYGDATATGFGNSGVGAVLGPGQFNWDISLVKNNKITERVKMQFRADFYNAFNHPQFSDPAGGGFATVGFEDIDSLSTSSITTTSVNPRLIQFGLHFIF